MPRRLASLAVSLILAASLGACATGTTSAGTTATPGPSTAPAEPVGAAPTPEQAAPGAALPIQTQDAAALGATAAPADPAVPDGTWSTGDSSGNDFGLTSPDIVSVSTESHDGYDRVVVELTRTDEPGWMVTTKEESGTWTLALSTQVLMGSTDYNPAVGGAGEQVGGTAIASASAWVTRTGILWLTVDAHSPSYRVSTLSDPNRLVLDVKQP